MDVLLACPWRLISYFRRIALEVGRQRPPFRYFPPRTSENSPLANLNLDNYYQRGKSFRLGTHFFVGSSLQISFLIILLIIN